MNVGVRILLLLQKEFGEHSLLKLLEDWIKIHDQVFDHSHYKAVHPDVLRAWLLFYEEVMEE